MRLCNFREDDTILSETKTGIRKGYSSIDHIFLMKHIDLYCFAFSVLLLIRVWYPIQYGGIIFWHKADMKVKFLDLVMHMNNNMYFFKKHVFHINLAEII